MKINELVQRGTKLVTREVFVPSAYDKDGNVLSEATTVIQEVEVPNMVSVTRDMTPDEEAEALEQQTKWEEYERNRPRTPEERCDAVEVKQTATEQDVNMLADTVLALCDIIEGGEQ